MKPKINEGSDFLIPKSEWVKEDEIQGNESKLFGHPVIDKAFERILDDWRPQHRVCLLSSCTTTRPYDKSVKWKKYIEAFEDKADLIVVSNAGIIPQKYWSCYPYMTYDSHGTTRTRAQALNILLDRMNRFFYKNDYEKVVVVAKHLSAVRMVALKCDRDIELVPTMCERELDSENRFAPYGNHFPELAEHCFAHTRRAIENI